MEFRRSRTVVPVLEYLEEAGSTNDVLVQRASDLPDLSVVVTASQTGGRGRLGRVWVAPPGKALAISILLKPIGLPMESYGWFPLLAGLAMSRAVSQFVPAGVAVKWPNDVHIDGAKVSGTLAELLPDLSGVVIGAGLNLTFTRDELPTDTSTSLLLAGVDPVDPDAVLAAYLTQFTTLYREFLTAGGDSVTSTLHDSVVEGCETIGRSVRVELPSGDDLLWTAIGIDDDGRLIVRSDVGITAVAAGDVTHLRY
jgi:BirA family biotin operon repressor/biotin-[acetyl-CoA-carboxylase] ligase